jgi:predicted ATPase
MTYSTKLLNEGEPLIKGAKIENYKCFKSAEVADCKLINLVVGKNGVGKTAFLEALFLASGTSPELVLRTKSWRGLDVTIDPSTPQGISSLWEDIFYQLDYNHQIQISYEGSGLHSRKLSVFKESLQSLIPFEQENSSGKVNVESSPIVFEWRDHAGSVFRAKPQATQQGLNLGGSQTPFGCHFFGAALNFGSADMASAFSDIQSEGSAPKTSKIMQEMFPSLGELLVGVKSGLPVLLAHKSGLKKSLPLQAISAGIAKVAAILLQVEYNRPSIIFVDEIESGIHYSVLGKLWESLFKLAESNNTQLFISTHSLENIEAVSKLDDKYLSNSKLYRIEQSDNGADVLGFDGNKMMSALKHGV